MADAEGDSGEVASVSENADRLDEAGAADASAILKHGNTGDEVPSENNGEHVEATYPRVEDNKDIFDGEEHGDDSGGAVDDVDQDHQDTACPSNGSNPLNGENSDDIQNDAVSHDSHESANELESDIAAPSPGVEAEFKAADDVEAEVTNETNDDNTAADAETEERTTEEHSDLHDVGPCEPSSEVIDAVADLDVVDAPSPMDVDVAQTLDSVKTPPDNGCDGAMEVEYTAGAEDTGISESCIPAVDSVSNENDQESPMAEDDDDSSRQSDHRTAEKVSELQDIEDISGHSAVSDHTIAEKVSELQDSENVTGHSAVSDHTIADKMIELQDSENVTGHSAVLDEAEYDEVDALQSEVAGHQTEVSDNSQDVGESGNVDGLVEGADFTVELQPDTSEQESGISEVDQPISETEVAEKTGAETETLGTEESGKKSDDVDNNTASTELPPVSSDAVSDRDATQELTETSDKPEQDSSAGSDDQSQQKVKDEETKESDEVQLKEEPEKKAGQKVPGAKSSKQQECIVCKKVVKCKYNIVRNGETKHLCDDDCFKTFRARPTSFLQSTRRAATAAECDYCHVAVGDVEITHTVGKVLKTFCQMSCLNAFKKSIATCVNCAKDIENDSSAIIATRKIGSSEETVVYCSESCQTAGSSAGSSTTCSVCAKVAPPLREVMVSGVRHQLCSEACFTKFRHDNRVLADECSQCSKATSPEVLAANTMHFNGASHRFCSAECTAAFRAQRQRNVPCEWCGAVRSNFDMVERVDSSGPVKLFCTLNCLSLFRVNLQANSGQSVACDQCHKLGPAQYHLTMSDASVRNFCSYPCVAAFQAQFTSPATSSAPTPVQKVTANNANSAPPPTTSKYGTRSRGRKSAAAAAAAAAAATATADSVYAAASSGTQTTDAGMVISNIVSLAPVQKSGQSATSVAPQTAQVIVQPPPPKEMRNKALLCKPFMQTKATSCRPHSVAKSTQTEENWEPKRMLLPCPVPMYTPTPVAMYSTPAPYPILVPVPIPVPCFIPTSRKTSKSIYKKIKDMQSRMPSDPIEAELLMMAEAVASGGRESDSESEVSDDDNSGAGSVDGSTPATATSAAGASGAAGSSGELAEDMLQMALRMASEMSEEPVMDLEDSVNPAPVRRVERPPVQDFGTISQESEIIQSVSGGRSRAGGGTPRPKRRSSGGGSSRSRSTSKKQRVEETSTPAPPVMPVNVTPAPPNPPADANFVLKFTYGVNAYKHWVLQKNAQIEKAAAASGSPMGSRFGGSRGFRPLKLDPLHCTADELNCALCMFVREVRKPNGDQYAPDSILYLCLGIQQYLFENNRIDNIFTDFYYDRFTDCLNEILSTYQVSLNSQGLLVCRIEEEHLWESKQLGAHSPHVLLNTLVYFNTKHFMLRTPAEHLALSFSHIMKHWKKTSSPSGKQGRSVYLRYYSPAQSTTDAGQKRRKEDMPVFEQAENVDNPLRCPVKLYEFYLSKCPESIKNRNDVFYLVPERSCVPDSPVWYSTMSLGIDAMTRMLNRLRPIREIQEAHLTATQIPAPTSYYN